MPSNKCRTNEKNRKSQLEHRNNNCYKQNPQMEA